MKLLLDTHVVMWATGESHKLSTNARDALDDVANELVISVVSACEVALKHQLGRLPDVGSLVRGWSAALQRIGATSMPMSQDHALAAGGLDWHHRDPFDRLLAAQAITENLLLVSSDRAMRYGAPLGLETLW